MKPDSESATPKKLRYQFTFKLGGFQKFVGKSILTEIKNLYIPNLIEIGYLKRNFFCHIGSAISIHIYNRGIAPSAMIA